MSGKQHYFTISIILLLLSNSVYSEVSVNETLKQAIQNLPDNAKDFSQQYMNPLIGNQQLSTLDGASQFNATISCPTSNAFLQVFAQPGTTGDLSLLTFSRDTDLDGQIDQTQNFPLPVSGICATGLISCNAGTWDDCSGYQWGATNDELTLYETGISKLGGCYCINGSCGGTQKSSRMIESIVSDLGSAAASVLARDNPQYAISSAQVEGPMAKFYGQELNCAQDITTAQLTNYFNNPADITSAASEYQTDADGIYQLVANSSAAQNSLITTKQCSIKRNTTIRSISAEDVISYNGGEGGIRGDLSEGFMDLIVGREGSNYWKSREKCTALTPLSSKCSYLCDSKNSSVSFYVDMPERIESVNLSYVHLDDRMQIGLEGQEIYSSNTSCSSGNSNDNPNVDITELFKQKGRVDFTTAVQYSAYGEGYAYVGVSFDDACEVEQEWFSNSCETFELDNNCRLKTETIDGVVTYDNYHPTGKIPLETAQTFTEGSCSVALTRDWWVAERTYECQSEVDFNFDEILQRKHTVDSTVTDTNYQDLADGVVSEQSLTLPDIDVQTGCTQTCKTKRVKDKTSIGSVGPVTDQIGTEYETLYRKCTGEDNTICPLEADETLVSACGCLNEFGAAASMMQALRQASQDLMCTTGDPYQF